MLIEYPITKLEFFSGVSRDTQEKGIGNGRFRYFTSGTYTSDSGITSAGPLMIGGNVVEAGDAKTWHRGGVAVMANGDIQVLRLNIVNTPADAKTDVARGIWNSAHTPPPRPQPASPAPGTPGIVIAVNAVTRVIGGSLNATHQALKTLNGVTDFMGGGAMVIENGFFVPGSDLEKVQQFAKGYDSAQLQQPTYRTAVGQKPNGNLYFIITDESPQTFATRLAGTYQNLVFFDGGNGFWAHDYPGGKAAPTRFGKGVNGVGIGVR